MKIVEAVVQLVVVMAADEAEIVIVVVVAVDLVMAHAIETVAVRETGIQDLLVLDLKEVLNLQIAASVGKEGSAKTLLLFLLRSLKETLENLLSQKLSQDRRVLAFSLLVRRKKERPMSLAQDLDKGLYFFIQQVV